MLRPLAIHVILQEAEPEVNTRDKGGATAAVRLARELYSRLSRGGRPTGIPVHLWIGKLKSSSELIVPDQPPSDTADRNAIILLIDQQFFDDRTMRQDYLIKLGGSVRAEHDLLLPVSISGDAHRIATPLNNVNCVPVRNPETVHEDEHVFQAILTAILRLLPEAVAKGSSDESGGGPAPIEDSPRVFLCHTKSDGDLLAHLIRKYIYEETQLTCFFDTHDIPHGYPVREFIIIRPPF